MSPRTTVLPGAFGILDDAVCAAFPAKGDRVARVDYAQPKSAPENCVDFGGVDPTDADFSKFEQPAAIADLTLFLASPAASRGISGALLPVSRGGPE